MNLYFKNDTPYTKMKIIGRKEKELEALLDTGSPYTLIPLNICEELGLKAEGVQGVQSSVGSGPLPVFSCIIKIFEQERIARVLGNKKFNLNLMSIIGRNLLREFKLELNWKKHTIKMKDPP
jgi:predicted aspartyl protease